MKTTPTAPKGYISHQTRARDFGGVNVSPTRARNAVIALLIGLILVSVFTRIPDWRVRTEPANVSAPPVAVQFEAGETDISPGGLAGRDPRYVEQSFPDSR